MPATIESSLTAHPKLDTLNINGYLIAFEVSWKGITSMDLVDTSARDVFTDEELVHHASTERRCPSPLLITEEDRIDTQEHKLEVRKWKRQWRRKSQRMAARQAAATTPKSAQRSLKRTARACPSLASYRCTFKPKRVYRRQMSAKSATGGKRKRKAAAGTAAAGGSRKRRRSTAVIVQKKAATDKRKRAAGAMMAAMVSGKKPRVTIVPPAVPGFAMVQPTPTLAI